MPIGGMYTVRGYRENQYVRDNGVAASLEWRIPVRPDRAGETRFDPWNLRVAPFVDYGRSWDREAQALTVNPVDIYSAGIGLLWNPMEGLRADPYWGHPFKEVQNPGTDLQDKGIHFAVGYTVPF
jgi:hemolysin activation/secretion protein